MSVQYLKQYCVFRKESTPNAAKLSLIKVKTTFSFEFTYFSILGLDQLEKSTANMVEWLEEILVYVKRVLATPELPENATIGRKLMQVCDFIYISKLPAQFQKVNPNTNL